MTFDPTSVEVAYVTRIIVSKSHGNTSMYVDTVINFAKNYHMHTHTTYYVHATYRISDHIVLGETKTRISRFSAYALAKFTE